ncbi:MAG: hypothetical protein NZM27_00385 [Acetobacteraceae bacterium]|nr:hypothetical protein [Acetobacteraceae bacterium]MDW8397502.1 hypothetical protein [Acetobacteraceae bacterium]
MPDPMPEEEFALLVTRAGIRLTAEEAERIRGVTGHLLAYMRSVRADRPLDAEPATIFRPVEPGR